MIAYHIDRTNSLAEGQNIRLSPTSDSPSFLEKNMFPQGVSMHGSHYLDESCQNIGDNNPSYYVLEYELELIRKAYFPKLPSRFQSLFALKSLDAISQWNDVFPPSSTKWVIEFEENNSILRDSCLLYPALTMPSTANNGLASFSPDTSFLTGFNYWNGFITEHPRMELLIKPPIKILKRLE